jgi:acetyl esterase/lipase
MTMKTRAVWRVLSCVALLLDLSAAAGHAQVPLTRPSIPERVSPIEDITIRARDGHEVIGVARRPPGPGPFPAVIAIHGTMPTLSRDGLREVALTNPSFARLLAAGYVTVIPTYRTDWGDDPQSPEALWDALAIVEHVRQMADVDPGSVAVYGCSGGGDLALQLAGEVPLAAVTAEEPATVLFTGMFDRRAPRTGPAYTGRDALPVLADPHAYYTTEVQTLARERIGRIASPIFIAQGDQRVFDIDNHVPVDEILVPELQAAGKEVVETRYPGQRHCFGFGGGLSGTDASASTMAAAGRFVRDMDAFFRRHLVTQPRPLDEALVEGAPALLFAGIAGPWVGTVTEVGPRSVTYEGTMFINGAGNLGYLVGSMTYRSSEVSCQVGIVGLTAAGNEYTVRQRAGTGPCADRGTVRISYDPTTGTVAWERRLADGTVGATATLKRRQDR